MHDEKGPLRRALFAVPGDLRARAAQRRDARALHELAAATFALACPPSTTASSISTFIAGNLSEERFRAHLADPTRLILVVDDQPAGRLAGYTMTVFEAPSDPDVVAALTRHPTAELSKFYLRAEHHGSGISLALMVATIEAVAFRDCAGLWLGVNQQNARANRFYDKHGFDVVGTKRFLVGERWEDDFVRELAVPGALL